MPILNLYEGDETTIDALIYNGYNPKENDLVIYNTHNQLGMEYYRLAYNGQFNLSESDSDSTDSSDDDNNILVFVPMSEDEFERYVLINYDIITYDTIPNEICVECPICLHLRRVSATLNCKHVFCNACITIYIKRQSREKQCCPLCRQKITRVIKNCY